MLLELVYPTTSVTVPALGEVKRQPKVIMLDTGLTNYQAGVRRELIGANDILDVWWTFGRASSSPGTSHAER